MSWRRVIKEIWTMPSSPFGIRALYRFSSLTSVLEINEIGLFALFGSKMGQASPSVWRKWFPAKGWDNPLHKCENQGIKMDTGSDFPIHSKPKWGGISLVAFETGAFVVKTCEVAAWLTTIAYFLFSGPFPKGSCVSALWLWICHSLSVPRKTPDPSLSQSDSLT